MSCPRLLSWDALLGAREADPSGRVLSPDQRTHLTNCAECRREAVRRDPSLAFVLALGSSDVSGSLSAARHPGVDAMLVSVRAAVRDLERDSIRAPRSPHGLHGPRSRRGDLRRSARWIAAAGLAALAFLARPAGLTPVSTPQAAPVTARRMPAVALNPDLQGEVSGFAAVSAPLVEDLDRPNARIYELADRPGDVSLVLIVDESLEI